MPKKFNECVIVMIIIGSIAWLISVADSPDAYRTHSVGYLKTAGTCDCVEGMCPIRTSQCILNYQRLIITIHSVGNTLPEGTPVMIYYYPAERRTHHCSFTCMTVRKFRLAGIAGPEYLNSEFDGWDDLERKDQRELERRVKGLGWYLRSQPISALLTIPSAFLRVAAFKASYILQAR